MEIVPQSKLFFGQPTVICAGAYRTQPLVICSNLSRKECGTDRLLALRFGPRNMLGSPRSQTYCFGRFTVSINRCSLDDSLEDGKNRRVVPFAGLLSRACETQRVDYHALWPELEGDNPRICLGHLQLLRSALEETGDFRFVVARLGWL